MDSLDTIYQQMVAKARASFPSGKEKKFNLGNQGLQTQNAQGDSAEYTLLKKYLNGKVQNYINNFNTPNQATYGSYENPYTADMGGIPTNVETGGNLYAKNDVGQYYNDIGIDTGGAGESTSSGSTGASALAYLIAALNVRGQGSSDKQIPWEQKTGFQKTTSAPLMTGNLYPVIGGLKLFGKESPVLDWLQKAEYDAMTPLYDFFVGGPASDPRDNSLIFPDAGHGAGTTVYGTTI